MLQKKYGMIQPKASTTQAVRAVFIIDPEAKIRAILYYPQSSGRNMQEIKRLLTALQKNEEEKVATPANWQPGEDVIVPPPSSMEAVKERTGKPEEICTVLTGFCALKKIVRNNSENKNFCACSVWANTQYEQNMINNHVY